MFTKIKIEGSKVTPQEVEAAIKEVSYHKIGTKMTIALVTLVDGFEVTGKAGVVDASTYDIGIGGKYALEKAKDRIWEHMGSILQDRLVSVGKDYKERLEIEREELMVKVKKLRNALVLKKVPEDSVEILSKQLKVMIEYADILDERLGY